LHLGIFEQPEKKPRPVGGIPYFPAIREKPFTIHMRGSTIDSALEKGVTSRISHVLSKFLNPYIVFHRFQKQNRNLKEEGGRQGNDL
jgi:hypothetical protein